MSVSSAQCKAAQDQSNYCFVIFIGAFSNKDNYLILGHGFRIMYSHSIIPVHCFYLF